MTAPTFPFVSRRPASVLLIAGTLLAASVASADELVVQGLPNQKVTILDFRDGRVVYQTARGDQSEREYERVQRLVVEGETAFNDAEKAFAEDKKPASIDNYIKAIRGTSKPWLRAFAARRLIDAMGPDSKRFDARVAAYIGVALTNPDEAAAIKPSLPEKGNRQLDAAVADIEAVLKQPNLGEKQQVELLTFLSEIHAQRGDNAAVNAIDERIDRAMPSNANDPARLARRAARGVRDAKTALSQRRYADAVRLVNENRAHISDPRAQSDALFILASANLQSVNKSDKTAMTDAALMFMRVVAHSNELDDKPNVLSSLQATADILAQIGNKEEAIAVYEQIARDFPDDPAARAAQSEIEKLKKE